MIEETWSRGIHYFEAHVNVSLIGMVGTPQHVRWERTGCDLRFKPSTMSGNDGHPDSERQLIFTAHAQDFEQLAGRVRVLCRQLAGEGATVLRYKIEAAVIESRVDDVWDLLDPETKTK